MTTPNLSFFIWCDGRIVSSPCGVKYHGGHPVNMALSERMNLEELQYICKRAVSTDSEVEITKIYFRLPRIEGGVTRSYSLFYVENNEHLFGILNEAIRFPQLDILELYVEYETLLDQLVSSISSGLERSSDEEEEQDFYDSNEEDVGKDSWVDFCDFDVASEADENIMWNPRMEFQEGMDFPNRDAIQSCATSYSVVVGREHKSHQTTNTIIVLVCRHNEICRWWLHATLLQINQTWTLTRYNGPHTCNQLLPYPNHRNFGSGPIANYIKTQVM
ncbi:uncharacterized protein LOC126672384 [Mercurialis annua]|uniref:uncharacterized protein LOC126672384 n=1 Tax=Mercurialis annua TaxID=3986 RepID=UPI002160BD4E|nr:uncharacterized protein LOC126672384 [Mercurialis annua]